MSQAIWLAALLAGGCPQQEAVLEQMAKAIEKDYVVAQEARQIAESVRDWADRGRYADACGDWLAFSTRLNRDLDAYDGHFHVERVVGEKAGADDDWLMAWRAAGVPTNMGVREVKVLEGNIGYLRLASFYPWDMARPKLLSAMELLKDTQGLVLDLRQNGGGDAETAGHLVRAFVDDTVSSLQDVQSRSGRKPEALPRRGLPEYHGGVVVLLDRRSASASEYVGYSLQAANRAVVIGSRSAGAATLMGDPKPLPHAFQIFIPDAQPINGRTGGNWNREGVTPDVNGGDDPIHVARRVLGGDLAVGESTR
ncbi:S41 family peptidase [Pseudoxanthomonas beigongshangi]